ncbi:ParB/RepB/Spo0J family partition protein, partial [uncultured Intestinimonas sp.]|uniref:ParB/RepB/Spo0J family partition protein n=1 Tax=uncultured Intestinimonas sp. TaxID=1689265 RepID=UPI002619E1DE
MADDKKNIPDAGKVNEPTEVGKVEPAKAAPPVEDQPAPAKTEAPAVEGASKGVTPLAAEAPKTAPSKESTPPGKDEKQTTIPGMGDPAPAGKVVDFTAARDGATKGKPTKKAAAQDKGKQADKAKDAAKPRRGRPPKADKAAPDKAKPQPRDKMSQSKPPAGKGAPATAEAPAATEQPPAPRDAARGVKEEIVYLNLSELHPFKNHPFGVRDDAEMQGLVESVKAAGVNQPALVRPREGGGYEIIAGHRRQRASELAGFVNMPCIVRNMTDDEAILAMTDDNLRHRERILPTEKAAALKQQVEAIKHQGARPGEDDRDAGKRSTQIVGDRNGMNYKQVQRYIRLTELVPDLQ